MSTQLPVRVRAYQCPLCETRWEDAVATLECCTGLDYPRPAYRCPGEDFGCRSGVHATYEDALACRSRHPRPDALCVCGGEARHHGVATDPGCYDPGCACRGYEAAP
jgi:hypothetical protein